MVNISCRASSSASFANCSRYTLEAHSHGEEDSFLACAADFGTNIHRIWEEYVDLNAIMNMSTLDITAYLSEAIRTFEHPYPIKVSWDFFEDPVIYMKSLVNLYKGNKADITLENEAKVDLFYAKTVMDTLKEEGKTASLPSGDYKGIQGTVDISMVFPAVGDLPRELHVYDIKTSYTQPSPKSLQLTVYLISIAEKLGFALDDNTRFKVGIFGRSGVDAVYLSSEHLVKQREKVVNSLKNTLKGGKVVPDNLNSCLYCPIQSCGDRDRILESMDSKYGIV